MAKSNAHNSILVIDSVNSNIGYLLDSNKKLSLVKFGELDSTLKSVKLSQLKVISYLPISGKNIDNSSYNSIYYPMQIIKSEEDPEEFIMSKLYSEYADKMDSTKEDNYIVKFVPTQSASPNHIDYDVLVYFDEDTKTRFGSCVAEFNYIDEIYPEPFLYKALYVKSALKPIGVDCFVYLDKERITITIYRAGEYLAYYENLQLKLSNIARQFSADYRENLGDTLFVEKLMCEGLDYSYFDRNTNSDRKIMELFNPYFDSHASVFAMIEKLCKRKNINNINNIIVNSCYGTIKGFSERMQQNYKDTKVIDFKDLELNLTINNMGEFYLDRKKSDENKEDKILNQANDAMEGKKPTTFDLNINMFSVLGLLWAQSEEKMENYVDVNITLFARPPKFFKRRSGQIISVFVIAFLLAWVFPIGTMVFNNYFNGKTETNNSEISERDILMSNSKQKIANEQLKLDRAREELSRSQNQLRFEKNLINQINDKKNNYLVKSKCLSSISELLHKNKITLKQMEYKEFGVKSLFLSVQAFDDNITSLVRDLIEQGYDVENKQIKRISDRPKKHEANITIKIKEGICK